MFPLYPFSREAMKIDCFCCTILHTIDIWYYHPERFCVWNMRLMDSCVYIPYSCHNRLFFIDQYFANEAKILRHIFPLYSCLVVVWNTFSCLDKIVLNQSEIDGYKPVKPSAFIFLSFLIVYCQIILIRTLKNNSTFSSPSRYDFRFWPRRCSVVCFGFFANHAVRGQLLRPFKAVLRPLNWIYSSNSFKSWILHNIWLSSCNKKCPFIAIWHRFPFIQK